MPGKAPIPQYDMTDTVTLLRMANGNTVKELQELSHYKRDSPISGDAIKVFTETGVVDLLEEVPEPM